MASTLKSDIETKDENKDHEKEQQDPETEHPDQDVPNPVLTSRITKLTEQVLATLDTNPDGFTISSSLFAVSSTLIGQDEAFNHLYHALQDRGYSFYVVPSKSLKKSCYNPQVLPDVLRVAKLHIIYDPAQPEKRLALRGARQRIVELIQSIGKLEQTKLQFRASENQDGLAMVSTMLQILRDEMEQANASFDD